MSKEGSGRQQPNPSSFEPFSVTEKQDAINVWASSYLQKYHTHKTSRKCRHWSNIISHNIYLLCFLKTQVLESFPASTIRTASVEVGLRSALQYRQARNFKLRNWKVLLFHALTTTLLDELLSNMFCARLAFTWTLFLTSVRQYIKLEFLFR